MATFKHISSKNADYGAAEQYLTFEHDEFTMKPIAIYFGEWIKSVIPIDLIMLLLLVHMVYIRIRCYVKERGHY